MQSGPQRAFDGRGGNPLGELDVKPDLSTRDRRASRSAERTRPALIGTR